MVIVVTVIMRLDDSCVITTKHECRSCSVSHALLRAMDGTSHSLRLPNMNVIVTF